MSYTIVYGRQFLKIDDKIIPLVLYGSNNCYESTLNGRERRERSWHPMYFGCNTMLAQTEEKIMERIQSCCGGVSQEHFMKSGKWVDDDGLIRFFKNGIRAAKTIEELKEEYFFYSMRGYFSVWNGLNKRLEHKVVISSSDDLRDFLLAAQSRLDNRAEKEEIYICLEYYTEKFDARARREQKVKEQLTDYYAIKVNDDGYLIRLTRKKLQYAFLCPDTKQFKTEKAAQDYMAKLVGRFKCTFEVKHIIA